MRHKVLSQRFDRPIGYRQMMFRNLVTEILDHEKIVTTEPKAKAVRGMAEKMITLGKAGGLPARRQALLHGSRLSGGSCPRLLPTSCRLTSTPFSSSKKISSHQRLHVDS
jgi:hypothetical protein